MKRRKLKYCNFNTESGANIPSTCCIEGPRGFPGQPGQQGTQGQEGESGEPGAAGICTLKFASGILQNNLTTNFLYLGFGTSFQTPSLPSPLVNSFSIPLPRAGRLSNFTVSVAHTLRVVTQLVYSFSIYMIPSSLLGTVTPIPPLMVFSTLLLTFEPTVGPVTPVQASIKSNLSFNITAGNRIGVRVAVVGGTYTDYESQTFNASLNYVYT